MERVFELPVMVYICTYDLKGSVTHELNIRVV